MKDKEKIELFWKITKRINKKFCKNKLKLGEISLFKKGELDESFKEDGYYCSGLQTITIKKESSLIYQLMILSHELAHAYQFQFLSNYYKKKKQKLKDNGAFSEKSCDKVMHDKLGGKINQKFLREIDKMLVYH